MVVFESHFPTLANPRDLQELVYEDNSILFRQLKLVRRAKDKADHSILSSAISYQFGITANMESNSSFRFVLIDEAFSKIDAKNSEQVMAIFNDLNIQVMIYPQD